MLWPQQTPSFQLLQGGAELRLLKPSVHLSICPSVLCPFLPLSLFFPLSIYSSIRLSIYPTAPAFIHPSSIHPSSFFPSFLGCPVSVPWPLGFHQMGSRKMRHSYILVPPLPHPHVHGRESLAVSVRLVLRAAVLSCLH